MKKYIVIAIVAWAVVEFGSASLAKDLNGKIVNHQDKIEMMAS